MLLILSDITHNIEKYEKKSFTILFITRMKLITFLIVSMRLLKIDLKMQPNLEE